jgi:hypothetical protein
MVRNHQKVVPNLCFLHSGIKLLILLFVWYSIFSSILYTPGVAESKAKVVLDTVKTWMKTWFFDVDAKFEYDFSRKHFFEWLNKQLEEESIPNNFFQAIKIWIGTYLDHYDSHWLNYLRLNVCGMNQRTSTICEALHSSMKSSFDKVQSNMSTSTSAMTQMTKAERRGTNQF